MGLREQQAGMNGALIQCGAWKAEKSAPRRRSEGAERGKTICRVVPVVGPSFVSGEWVSAKCRE